MKSKTLITVCLIIVVIVAAIVSAYLYAHSQKTITTSTQLTGCRAETLTIGSSGNCVKDIQTMTDYMQTAGLTECPFDGGRILPVNGTYDATTATQVKVVQNWADCYYKQEGMNLSITTSGNVDNSTWLELCNFAYDSPKQSGAAVSSYTQASITAGKDAHC